MTRKNIFYNLIFFSLSICGSLYSSEAQRDKKLSESNFKILTQKDEQQEYAYAWLHVCPSSKQVFMNYKKRGVTWCYPFLKRDITSFQHAWFATPRTDDGHLELFIKGRKKEDEVRFFKLVVKSDDYKSFLKATRQKVSFEKTPPKKTLEPESVVINDYRYYNVMLKNDSECDMTSAIKAELRYDAGATKQCYAIAHVSANGLFYTFEYLTDDGLKKIKNQIQLMQEEKDISFFCEMTHPEGNKVLYAVKVEDHIVEMLLGKKDIKKQLPQTDKETPEKLETDTTVLAQLQIDEEALVKSKTDKETPAKLKIKDASLGFDINHPYLWKGVQIGTWSIGIMAILYYAVAVRHMEVFILEWLRS